MPLRKSRRVIGSFIPVESLFWLARDGSGHLDNRYRLSVRHGVQIFTIGFEAERFVERYARQRRRQYERVEPRRLGRGARGLENLTPKTASRPARMYEHRTNARGVSTRHEQLVCVSLRVRLVRIATVKRAAAAPTPGRDYPGVRLDRHEIRPVANELGVGRNHIP